MRGMQSICVVPSAQTDTLIVPAPLPQLPPTLPHTGQPQRCLGHPCAGCRARPGTQACCRCRPAHLPPGPARPWWPLLGWQPLQRPTPAHPHPHALSPCGVPLLLPAEPNGARGTGVLRLALVGSSNAALRLAVWCVQHHQHQRVRRPCRLHATMAAIANHIPMERNSRTEGANRLKHYMHLHAMVNAVCVGQRVMLPRRTSPCSAGAWCGHTNTGAAHTIVPHHLGTIPMFNARCACLEVYICKQAAALAMLACATKLPRACPNTPHHLRIAPHIRATCTNYLPLHCQQQSN